MRMPAGTASGPRPDSARRRRRHANAEVVSGWVEKWSPLASEALEAFAGVTAEAPVPLDPSAVTARITDEVSSELGAVLER